MNVYPLSLVDMAGFLKTLQIMGLLYVLSVGAMYYLSQRTKQPMIVPGDIYRRREGRVMYIPTGGALVLMIILYIVLIRIIPGIFGQK
ncbi:DUF2905 family protein [Candidatus Woesebacteria bacterium]|nr:MAG: DUF2905 family protein [Candidatus Woesebacteria bacterium]